ncbi:MAG: ATP-binding protein [Candidatus Marinimicrobia bacterium]|nr:ATP-binding protein [Candidatus Neomarinimicrobiota bacterium]
MDSYFAPAERATAGQLHTAHEIISQSIVVEGLLENAANSNDLLQQDIAIKLFGKVSFSSRPADGTVFTLSLPL